MQHWPIVQPTTPRCPVSKDRPSYCPRAAGFGTDHPGIGLCRQHELREFDGRDRIPQAVFQEARYVDELDYHETADGEAPEDWEAVA
jgi:hypothetical protein